MEWIAEGMGWVIMDSYHDKQPRQATKSLIKNGKCQFDLSKNGSRLQPIGFGSCACTDMESKSYSFTG